MSDSVQPHRRQPTRLPRPWDSPGKNTGVGCHFLLQCMKVKRESEVAQSCPTLSDLMDCRAPGSSIHGIFQARVLEWGAIETPNSTTFSSSLTSVLVHSNTHCHSFTFSAVPWTGHPMARPRAWHCRGHRGHSARNSDAEALIASSESIDIHKNQYLLSINHAQTSSLC